LNDRDTRGQLGELEEVASVVGNRVEGVPADLDGVLRVGGIDQRRLGGDHDLFIDGTDFERQIQVDGRTDGELQTVAHQSLEPFEGRSNLVGSQR